jgi:hypothetical protein
VTVVLKELFNLLTFVHRLSGRRSDPDGIRTSFTLDAYTSVFCNDFDGALSEFYFANTGLALLAMSLASSVSMNLLLSDLTLNIIVAATFAMAWIASFAARSPKPVRIITSLRRAGRFVWSETPFLNFFSLIYIATVRHGKAKLYLKDYVIIRAISIVELVFVKLVISTSSLDEQQALVRAVMKSEKVVLKAKVSTLPRYSARKATDISARA